MKAVKHQGSAETTAEHAGFHLDIGRIKPPHVTDLYQPATQFRLCGDDIEALDNSWGQRLFTEHRLARRNAGQHQLLVSVIRRGHQHGVDSRILDERSRVGSDGLCTRFIRDGFGSCRIGIVDCLYFRPWHLRRENARVIGPHHANPDNSDTYAHVHSPAQPPSCHHASSQQGVQAPPLSWESTTAWMNFTPRAPSSAVGNSTRPSDSVSPARLAAIATANSVYRLAQALESASPCPLGKCDIRSTDGSVAPRLPRTITWSGWFRKLTLKYSGLS